MVPSVSLDELLTDANESVLSLLKWSTSCGAKGSGDPVSASQQSSVMALSESLTKGVLVSRMTLLEHRSEVTHVVLLLRS